jgi:hypothetical protein
MIGCNKQSTTVGGTMRTLALCLIALVLPASAVGVGTEAKRVPALRLLDRQPLVLRGSSFLPRELVRVTVTTEGQRTMKRFRATATGTFTANFVPAQLDRCSGALVVAAGLRGSEARLKVPQPACAPA